MRSRDSLKVWSVGEPQSPERDLIERFFDGLDKYTPDLVSWNGSGFDLPVLHYRSLLHSLTAARYWENGDRDSSFRYSNYLSRFHWRHIDLMDVLSGFQGRGRASLDDVATLLGFPGKLGMQGSQVWEVFLQGGIGQIRDYCETDVLNTYLVYLRFQLLRGHLDAAQHTAEVARVRKLLEESTAPHLKEFAAAWRHG
jgi:predicted PolB exonuclease-like 3'-5' exonuclease